MQRQRTGPEPVDPEGDGLPLSEPASAFAAACADPAADPSAAARNCSPPPAATGPGAGCGPARGTSSQRPAPSRCCSPCATRSAATCCCPPLRLLVRAAGPARRAPAYHAPVPAECGGVPDPFALLEAVRRVRAEGGARARCCCPWRTTRPARWSRRSCCARSARPPSAPGC
ncbi:hypothetical protein NKH77_41570 [Streptomyces sp. M19]